MDEDKFELEVCRLELRYKTMESGWVVPLRERDTSTLDILTIGLDVFV
jgi:hypothetical protein